MKKLFAILAISATLAACNDATNTDNGTDTDSLRAAATADSINAANALNADTANRLIDSVGMRPIDSLK